MPSHSWAFVYNCLSTTRGRGWVSGCFMVHQQPKAISTRHYNVKHDHSCTCHLTQEHIKEGSSLLKCCVVACVACDRFHWSFITPLVNERTKFFKDVQCMAVIFKLLFTRGIVIFKGNRFFSKAKCWKIFCVSMTSRYLPIQTSSCSIGLRLAGIRMATATQWAPHFGEVGWWTYQVRNGKNLNLDPAFLLKLLYIP